MSLWLSTRRSGWCILAALAGAVAVFAFGAVTVPFPSLVSSALPLPVALIVPLGMVIVLAWALASSDPRMEAVAVRSVGWRDVALVLGITLLGAVASSSAGTISSGDSGAVGPIAARATLGFVGLMLCARRVVPADAAASAAVFYVLLVAFLAGSSMETAPMWAWALRPPDDVTSWAIAVGLLAVGLLLLAMGRGRLRWQAT